MRALRDGESSYLKPEKRLANELGDTIGCEPATMLSFAAGAAAAATAGVSATEGFSGGRAAACFVSGFGVAAAVFGAEASGRGTSVRLTSTTFGFAGMGCAVAVVSAAPPPPRPTLRARLLKKPSDCAFGAADATRVAGAVA